MRVPVRAALIPAAVLTAFVTGHAAPAAHHAALGCLHGAASRAAVGHPTSAVAWRAGLGGPTAVYPRPRPRGRRAWVYFSEAPWLLVVGADRLSSGSCMVKVRLPSRPNGGAGWVESRRVALASTPWRITISRSGRKLALTRAGHRVLRVPVVVGKRSTPTPKGLFAIAQATPSNPGAFVGSWVLALTAHSYALQRFDGGNGTVAIHGRGGASLVDPLGSAASHGCIRLANAAIDGLVHRVGRDNLVGTPVQVT